MSIPTQQNIAEVIPAKIISVSNSPARQMHLGCWSRVPPPKKSDRCHDRSMANAIGMLRIDFPDRDQTPNLFSARDILVGVTSGCTLIPALDKKA